MSSEEDSREQGVDFGPLADDLEEGEYPMSKADLLETYGDREIDLESGSQTLKEVIEPIGEDEFDSAADVKTVLIGMVSDEAVGRKNYSDRSGDVRGGEETDESL